MPLQSGIYPSTTASFIIRNNSSIKRTIKVFGVKLNPGQTIDLMSIPGVTEEDIRSELTKGSLKALFAGGSLVVVSSSINVSSGSSAHQQFLSGIGLTDRIFRLLPVRLRGVALDGPAGTNPYIINNTVQSLTLPDDAKMCATNQSNGLVGSGTTAAGGGFIRAGAVVGPLSFSIPGFLLFSQGFAMSPSGDLIVFATDAITSLDFGYFPEQQDVVNGVYVVTPGTGVVLGLPLSLNMLMEAEIINGGVVGKCAIQVPVGFNCTAGGTNGIGPVALSTLQARLTAGKQGVAFCTTDAVTLVRLKLGVAQVKV